jgi:hypothetical protein
MSLSERIQELNRAIGSSVEQTIAELRQEISQRLQAGNEEIQRRIAELAPRLPASFLSHDDFVPHERQIGSTARDAAFRELRDGVAGIDRARSQGDILNALLRESLRHASRSALLLIRGGEARGWGGQGFGDADGAVRELALNAQDGAWGRLLGGEGAVRLSPTDCATLCSRLEAPLPQGGVLIPLVLRDKVAAALYADRLGDSALEIEALQVLAHTAALGIETLPFRERAATPTLILADGEPEAAAAEAPAAAAPPVPEPEPAAEPAASDISYTSDTAAAAVAADDEAGEDTAATPAPDWDVSQPSYTEELSANAIAAAAAPVESPLTTQRSTAAAMEEDVPRYPRSVEEPPAPAPQLQNASPEATVLLPRPSLAVAEPAPAPPTPLRPVPVPEPTPFERPAAVAGSGTPEVRPPSGVDGPGWAFATTRVPVSPSDEAMHEEARRLARLLVSEIKLYNEEQVEEGRRNRDIYERLKEDIDRSRQMYEDRVDPRILRSTDYFYQELVRILAAGDSRALGI